VNERGVTVADQRLFELVARFHAGQINRRELMRRAAAIGVSMPVVTAAMAGGTEAAPAPGARRTVSRAQTDPTTLVVLDDLQGQNWLYLDPGKFYEINPSAALILAYETLYHLPDAADLTKFEPLLAESMPEFAADGLSATIKLRQGVTFHNSGNPLTAADVVFSFNRLGNLLGNPSFLVTDYFESFEAVDDATLKLTLKSPNAATVAILSSVMFSVIDSTVAQENGGTDQPGADSSDTLTDWINQGNSIGTGSYALTQWDVAGEVILEANPNYWGTAPKFERVIFRNVAEPSTQLQLLETGEADIAFAVDPDNLARVTDNPALQLLEGASLAHEYIAMHNDAAVGGPLAKKEARQAIAHAIDYDGIINDLLAGGAVRPATVVPLGLLATEEVKDLAYQTDLAKAQELWDASGNGEVELTLTFGSGQSTPAGLSRDILAPKLQADIQRINGVTVTLTPMPSDQRLAEYRAGNLQFTMSDWSPDYPDVHTYADPFGKTGGAAANRIAYSNPQVDELLNQGIAELDQEKRTQIYVDIQKLLIEDAAFVVDFQPIYRSPASAAVTGASPHGVYILDVRTAEKTTQ
jgi:peptide/nickel transport system substrate-binding protein